MNVKTFLRFEVGRLLSKRKALISLFFYLFAVYLIQSGIAQYNNGFEERKRFQEFEKTRIENFQYYAQYGTYGFRLLYVPGPLSAVFSNAGIISANLNAFIDSGERMKIYESFKGKNVFVGYTSIFLNLTGLLLLFGSLLSLFFGFESYKDKEYLRFLDGLIGNRKKLFGFILSIRLLLLFTGCLLIALTTILLFTLDGLGAISIGHFCFYILVAFLMLAFFLLIGVIAGALKTKLTGLISVFLVWLLFVFLLPAMVSKIVYNRADSTLSAYNIEMEKLKLMMTIEKKAKEQAGKLDVNNTRIEIRQKLHEYFWNNEFKLIFNQELTMISDMKDIISLHHNLSLIFPTSFYLSVNNEISGRGYENLIAFYEHAYRLKMGFIQYYAEKSFYSDEKTIKPYLKGEGNIFHAPSLLPGNFGFGLIISSFWLVLLILFSWVSFIRMVDRQPEIEKGQTREIEVDDIKNGKVTIAYTSNPWRLYQLISKIKAIKIKFALVPSPADLPGDCKVKSLFTFFNLHVPEKLIQMEDKYYESLTLNLKALVIMEIIKSLQVEILIFNGFLVGLSEQFKNHFKEFLEASKRRRRIVYFTNSLDVTDIGNDIFRFPGEKHSL